MLLHVVSFVFQTGYKEAFHLIKVQILALMAVPLFQVPENKLKD